MMVFWAKTGNSHNEILLCVITAKALLLIVKNTVQYLITVNCGRMQPHAADTRGSSGNGLVNEHDEEP